MDWTDLLLDEVFYLRFSTLVRQSLDENKLEYLLVDAVQKLSPVKYQRLLDQARVQRSRIRNRAQMVNVNSDKFQEWRRE